MQQKARKNGMTYAPPSSISEDRSQVNTINYGGGYDFTNATTTRTVNSSSSYGNAGSTLAITYTFVRSAIRFIKSCNGKTQDSLLIFLCLLIFITISDLMQN